MVSRKILILGASLNESRYSCSCLRKIAECNYPVEAIGLREGTVSGITVQKGLPVLSGVHTVTLYIGARNQPPYYQYLLDLNPARVIFNPGTENPEFEKMLEIAGIEVLEACSIMMLNAGIFWDTNDSLPLVHSPVKNRE